MKQNGYVETAWGEGAVCNVCPQYVRIDLALLSITLCAGLQGCRIPLVHSNCLLKDCVSGSHLIDW